MKQLFLVVCSIVWLNGFSQNLHLNPWRINTIIGGDTSRQQELILQKIDTTSQHWAWGNTIRFLSDGNFKISTLQCPLRKL